MPATVLILLAAMATAFWIDSVEPPDLQIAEQVDVR
jgi:hypothetical protein